MTLRLLVDSDGGVDDVLALLLALRTPGVRLEAVTTVAGNATLADATRNACFALELAGSDAPVVAGASAPLSRAPLPPRGVHGSDGLGDLGLRPAQKQAPSGNAVQSLVDLLQPTRGDATLVTLGPLTNLAGALRRDPAIAGRLRRCVAMGGTLRPGAEPELNLRWDPEAASLVLRAGLPLTLVPIDVSRGAARLEPAEYAALAERGDAPARTAALLLGFLGRSGVTRYGWSGEAAVPDAVAMAVALDPTIAVETERRALDMATSGEAAGRLIDAARRGGPPITFVRAIDPDGFKRALTQALTGDAAP